MTKGKIVRTNCSRRWRQEDQGAQPDADAPLPIPGARRQQDRRV